jgi:hypothetical protein
MKDYNTKYRLSKRALNWNWYLDLKRKPCTDCGETFDPYAMDWDHQVDKKESPATLMAKSRNREVILNEISKCELVCANCHRIRTYSQVPRWEYRPTELNDTIQKLKYNKPCVDCGLLFPSVCMDFDHRDPSQKKYTIARMKSLSLKFLPALLEEIAKCDLVCHCCHRLRTAKKSQWQS